MPFIGYTYVKERFTSDPVFTTGNDDLSLLRQRINELEADQKSQSHVIAQLRQEKLVYEQEKGKQWNVDSLSQKVMRLESERDNLEHQLEKAERDSAHQRKGREADAEVNKKSMEEVTASVREMLSVIEKERDLRNQLSKEIQV